MNVTNLHLPHLLEVARRAGGMAAVKKLTDAFGGRMMYVPRRENCPDNHVLVQALGRDVADALCDAVGGLRYIEIPKGSAMIPLLVVAGMLAENPRTTANQIAAALDITYRHARRLRKQLKARRGLMATLADAATAARKNSPQIDLEEWLKVRGFTPSK